MLERKTTSWGSSLYPGGDPTTARDRRGWESAYVIGESATKVAYVHFVTNALKNFLNLLNGEIPFSGKGCYFVLLYTGNM
jgi:hypothetical protein